MPCREQGCGGWVGGGWEGNGYIPPWSSENPANALHHQRCETYPVVVICERNNGGGGCSHACTLKELEALSDFEASTSPS